MGRSIKETIVKAKSMDKESTCGVTVHVTKEIGTTIKSMVKALMSGWTVESIRATGRTI